MWGTPLDITVNFRLSRFIPTYVGNTVAPASVSILPAGSSPRMWGTRIIRLHRIAMRRFIPTYVGNTAVTSAHSCISAVHPHVCGEHPIIGFVEASSTGSSPRMWGTLGAIYRNFLHRRFIPTYVGNTFFTGKQPRDTAVHPHVCGEHSLTFVSVPSPGGSSPRMWGTLMRYP